jgi:hypothetical protein
MLLGSKARAPMGAPAQDQNLTVCLSISEQLLNLLKYFLAILMRRKLLLFLMRNRTVSTNWVSERDVDSWFWIIMCKLPCAKDVTVIFCASLYETFSTICAPHQEYRAAFTKISSRPVLIFNIVFSIYSALCHGESQILIFERNDWSMCYSRSPVLSYFIFPNSTVVVGPGKLDASFFVFVNSWVEKIQNRRDLLPFREISDCRCVPLYQQYRTLWSS